MRDISSDVVKTNMKTKLFLIQNSEFFNKLFVIKSEENENYSNEKYTLEYTLDRIDNKIKGTKAWSAVINKKEIYYK